MIEVLNPTFTDASPTFAAAPRTTSLAGTTVGIISNGKHGTRPFFTALGDWLVAEAGGAKIDYVTKPNYSAPAGDDIIDQAREWAGLISGIGD